VLQQTAAAILVLECSLCLNAAAAAELRRSAVREAEMLRRWLGIALVAVGVAGGVGLWRFPLVLRSGPSALPVGSDTFAHDGYLSIPAGLPVACVALVGLVLLFWSRSEGTAKQKGDADSFK